MAPRSRLHRFPLALPAGFLLLGAMAAGQQNVPLEALGWLVVWLLWPAAAAVVLDRMPGHPMGIVLATPALAPVWMSLIGDGAATVPGVVVLLVASPPVLVAAGVFPWAVRHARGEHGGARAMTASGVAVLVVLGLVCGAALTGRLTPAGLYLATGAMAIAPFGLAWLTTTDSPPAMDRAFGRAALGLAAIAAFATAYAAAVVLLAATNVPDQRAAGAVLAAVAAIGLMPGLLAARRWLLVRLYGSGRTPGQAHLDLSHRLQRPADPDSLLQEVADSVARSVRSPSAQVRLTPGGETITDGAQVPLLVGEREVGTLVVAPRQAGERFTATDLSVLRGLAPQIAVVAEAVLLGRRLAAAQDQILRLRDAERERIRTDLHDVLGPLLAGLRMHVAAARGATSPTQFAERLDHLEEGLEQCRTEVRRLTRDLHPPTPRPALSVTLRSMVDDWISAAARSGPRFESAVHDVARVPVEVGTAVRLVAGEAVTNVIRHADASWCRISLRADAGQLILAVEDDGRGLGRQNHGLGLPSMRRRIEEVGGLLTVGDRQPHGTTVTARVPYRTE
ncbi:ATP-binding protein [Actinoplanes sp. NPDC051633]|uniref:sensor histidine kinase n=1 Tax=Actinoplanes sp. NPDC051633 TaxID=3155670 RepID=UPI0034165744